MILLTGLYKDADPSRFREFLECLERNVEADRIEEIHVSVEDGTDPQALVASHPRLASAKIRWNLHGRRLTYRDLFSYANQRLGGCAVIIANADIFFDGTLTRLDGYDYSNKLLCLSRWDVQEDGSATFFDWADSQDAWIFRAPIREFFCDFQLGLLGCDNRLAWEAENAGLAISNPGRSLRAYHLHLSRVRRYNEGQRVYGPIRLVPTGFLGTRWLWFVVPCMARLSDLRLTIGSLVEQPESSYVLVDYSCPEEAGKWVRHHHRSVTVVSVGDRVRFNGSEARNRGAAAVDDDGVICFLDADMSGAPGLSEHILNSFEPGSFMVPDLQGPGFDSAVVCAKADLDRVGGFDEVLLDWGDERALIKAAFRRSGMSERVFPASLLSPVGRGDACSNVLRVIRDREVGRSVNAGYQRAKSAIIDETGPEAVPSTVLREIYRAVMRRHLADSGQSPDLPCAIIAFRESMGYTVARLEVGVSSHNNDSRPFSTIPESLAGLEFTQVVAYSISPVEIEFVTSGKLYVLVGNDWYGYDVARAWLSNAGFREPLPLVETSPGPAFEVWSLMGDAGDSCVLPTQVVLVASQLMNGEAAANPANLALAQRRGRQAE
jgi:hypothetical protein